MATKKILTDPEEIFKEAIKYIENNELEVAKTILQEAEARFPNEYSLTNLLAQIALRNNEIEEGIIFFKKSLQINSNQPLVLFDLGIAFLNINKYEESIVYFDKSIKLDSKNIKTYLAKVSVLKKINRSNELIDCFLKIIELNPKYINAYTDQAELLSSMGEVNKALDLYNKAIKIEPNNSAIYNNLGNIYFKLDRLDDAISCYEKSLKIKPNNAGVYKNLGNVFIKNRNSNQAIKYLEKSIKINEDYEIYINLAVIYSNIKNNNQANKYFDKALILNPNEPEAYVLKAYHLQSIKKLDEAITNFDHAFKIDENYKYLHGEKLHANNIICNWSNYDSDIKSIYKKLNNYNNCPAVPLSLFYFFDDLSIQMLATELYVKDKYPYNSILGSLAKYPKNKKIKLGYFSGDFREHPVAYSLSEIFEFHDKNKFELIAFSVSSKINSKTRTRIEKSFDEFIDVASYSDKEVALLARDKKIDIAVDLGGYTKNSRPAILSMKVAPVQINYLGYPGTSGANYFDYIISDKFTIPTEAQKFYSEKIIYLPKCSQPLEKQVLKSKNIFTRKKEGIPESAFVFCCFNNSYKITPIIFKIWIRLLIKIKESILWFPGFSSLAIKNLKSECIKLGVDDKRLIFSSIEKFREDHHAKIKLADVFLDTYPFGGHTTVSDFLKAGVPIITLRGNSIPNRVASSMLINLNLPELITSSEKEYEELAIKLATDQKYLKNIKTKLISNVNSSSIFDSEKYIKDLESAYIQAYDNQQNNLNTKNIEI